MLLSTETPTVSVSYYLYDHNSKGVYCYGLYKHAVSSMAGTKKFTNPSGANKLQMGGETKRRGGFPNHEDD